MKPPIIFTRMGSSSEITVPVKGPALTEGASVTYTTGKFGNAIQLGDGAAPANSIQIPAATIADGTYVTIEFWYKHNITFAAELVRCSILRATTATQGAFDCMIRPVSPWAIDLSFFETGIIYKRAEWDHADLSAVDTYFDLGGDWHHYAFTFDANAAQPFKFYKDGISKGAPDRETSGGSMSSVVLINEIQNVGTATGANESLCGIIDNLKVYDYIKTDFSDRYYERGGMNDQVMSL